MIGDGDRPMAELSPDWTDRYRQRTIEIVVFLIIIGIIIIIRGIIISAGDAGCLSPSVS